MGLVGKETNRARTLPAHDKGALVSNARSLVNEVLSLAGHIGLVWWLLAGMPDLASLVTAIGGSRCRF